MDSTPQQPQPEDDWLLSPTTAAEPAPEPEPAPERASVLSPTEVLGDGPPVQPTDVTPRKGHSQLLGASGLVAAGLIAGVVGTFALGHHGSGTTTFQPAGSSTQQGPGGFPPGQQNGTAPQGGITQQGGGTTTQGQQGFGPLGGFGGGPGGLAGEQHVQGSVAGVSGSTLRVTTSSGTKSYTITSATEVIRNGQAATLSQLRAGDPVLVHVVTTNGSSYVERVIAGTLGQGGFPGGPPGTSSGGAING